jgi:hypothetical protein
VRSFEERGGLKKDVQEHEHSSAEDEEATKISDATRGEYVAPSIVMTIALRVRVVEVIVRLSYIHSEGAKTPFGRIGRERELEESKVSASNMQVNRSRLHKRTLSAIEGPLREGGVD